MKIIRIKKITNCRGANNVRDLLLDGKVTYEFIHYMGKLGKLLITEDIDKPFFRIIIRGKYTVKGSLGNNSIRLYLPETGDQSLLDELSNYINDYEKS